MLLATLAVLALGIWLGIDGLRWAVLTLVIAQVWIAEFINAAIEAAVDLQTQTFHPLAKRAKDVGGRRGPCSRRWLPPSLACSC